MIYLVLAKKNYSYFCGLFVVAVGVVVVCMSVRVLGFVVGRLFPDQLICCFSPVLLSGLFLIHPNGPRNNIS